MLRQTMPQQVLHLESPHEKHQPRADMEHILRNNSWTLAVQTWLCSFGCQPKCCFTTYFSLGFLLERNIGIIWNHFLACKFGKTDLCLHYDFNMTLRWLFNDQFEMLICSWCLYDSLPGPTFSYTEQKTIVKSSCCCNMFFDDCLRLFMINLQLYCLCVMIRLCVLTRLWWSLGVFPRISWTFEPDPYWHWWLGCWSPVPIQ
jgi:hypothetical protein